VLSDGEDHGESDLSVVDTIRKQGGLIFSIAYGTEKGAPIPIRDEKGELHGYKKDSAGNVVVTGMKPEVLTEVATKGGGQFYHSTQDEAEVDDILARVNEAQRGSLTTIKTTVWEEYYWIFLAPGLLLLLISFLSWKALKPWLRVGAVALLLVRAPAAEAGPISFFWNKDRKASDQSEKLAKEKKFGEAADSLKPLQADDPDNPAVNYDIGTYLLADKKAQQGREQLGHLRNADGILRDTALYNIAGSYAEEGKKEEARASYAELIQHLQSKSQLTKEEAALLAQAKRNVARLADPSQPPPQQQQQQQQQQQGGGGDDKKDQKNDQSKQDDKKDQQKKDDKNGKGEKDQKKDDKGKDEQKKDEKKDDKGQDKKDDQGGGGKQEPPQGNQAQQLPPRHGGQPFKERDDMGEEDAKRILGALKERESDLQKRFLKNSAKGGRVNADDAAKDW